MSIWIQGIATAVPEHCYTQQGAARSIGDWTKNSRDRRLSDIAHKVSGIEKRYSVLRSLDDGFFERDAAGEPAEPTTGMRNAIYHEASLPLAEEAVERLFSNHAFERTSVTHIITVSCTGFFNPGLDFHIIDRCGLSDGVQRYHLGFMGCYAALSALRMAKQFCEADPEAVVLVVSIELCSLHLKPNGDRDAILANALFADGAAACLVSAGVPAGRALRLGHHASELIREGASEMAWNIGDLGFDMVLSSYVPKLLGRRINEPVSHVLRECNLSIEEIDRWAVHPGGKAILEEVSNALGLRKEQLESSELILRNFGNMSSATVLFVLQDLLSRADRDCSTCALAFGPGLTVELFQLDAVINPGAQ